MSRLARILVYPIKSLDPVSLLQVRVQRGGALENDRRWAIVDASGKLVNGKRSPVLHRLRATYDDVLEHVTFRFEDREACFHLSQDLELLEAWLSEVLVEVVPRGGVRLLENTCGGYPDDTEAPGPTVISSATLETVASWFPAMSVDECRLRFRTNLELGETVPFWEDRLYGPAGSQVDFCIGSVTFAGTNPCQRCPVPARDPHTGDVRPRFTPDFSDRREATLPHWAERTRFNHFYRLAVNTHLVSSGGTLHVGDEVNLVV